MRFLSKATRLVVSSDRQSYENYIRLGIFLAVLAAAGAALLLRDRFALDQVGYGGVALSALVASAGLVIPVPALATVCTTSAFLNPLYIGLIAGFCETLGESTGYFLGYSGRSVINRTRLYQTLERWMGHRGWMPLFLLSLVPNPVFDFIGVAAGALHYPLWRFYAVVGVGKLIKFLAFAYACTYSIEWLTDLFGL